MPAKPKKTKDKQEDAASDVSDNQNEYLKDDFVVDSAEDEDPQEEQINSENEEYNSLELSEEDFQLIEENKKKTKGGRLQRKIDSSDEEPKGDEEYQEDEDPKDRIKRDDQPEQMDEEVQDHQQVLEELFDPTQRQQGFLEDLDEKICALDIPERIQQMYLKAVGRLPEPVARNIDGESDLVKWITKRLLSERSVQIKVSEQEQFQDGVRQILESYRNDYMEAYYIFTYKRHLITPIIELHEYWRIQELDIEYQQFSSQRESLRSKLKVLEYRFSPLIEQMLNDALRPIELADISEYLQYIELKIACKRKVEELRAGREIVDLGQVYITQRNQKRDQAILEALFFRMDDLAPKVSYLVDEFAELLAGNTVDVRGRGHSLTIGGLDDWVDVRYQQVSEKKKIILLLQTYITMEYFKHPFIRQYVGSEYNRYAQLTTEPTQQGHKEVNALSYLFPVKRIRNRPVKFLEDETFLMVLQAEELNFIKSTFKVQEHQKQEKRQLRDDELQSILITKFKQFGTYDQKEDDTVRIDTLRDFIFRKVLEKFYPFLERRLREHLREQANLCVLRTCAREFRAMINQPPHQSNVEIESQMNQQEPADDSGKRIMSLVLAYDETVQQNDLTKTFTKDYSLQRKHTAMVVVDRKGEVMTQQVFNYLTLSKQQLQTRPDLADLRKSESDYLEAIFQQYQPDLIVISANQPECLRIRADLREQWANQRPWISVADTTVPHIFSLSDRAQQQLPETPAILREAISLARLKLNPLAEILNVWSDNSDENGCLHIQLHPMQRMVPQWRLHLELQKVAVEIVNSAGVELVDATLHIHLQSQVQFLCGLGPRKAKRFLQSFKCRLSKIYLENHFESEARILSQLQQQGSAPLKIERLDVLKYQLLPRNVFKNIQGFFKFSKGKNPFDRTRLITQMYNDAYYIAKSALDVEVSKEDRDYSIVLKLMKQPQKLDDLELEEWAVQKEQKEKLRNYIKVVNFMKNELTNPFQHYYEKADEMSNKEIFYKVTQESPNTFKKYSIVTGPIMWIKDELLCIRISDAGLTGILHKREFEKERVNMKDEFTEGQVIKAYVKNIEALEDKRERKNDAKNINIFRVDLTLKPDWNSVLPEMIVVAKPEHWARAYKYEDYVHKVKSTFDLKEARYQDCPSIQLGASNNIQIKLVIRKINHPKFKQVMLKGATDYIESQKVGEYIIRPSSRGKEYLTITWKFFEGVIVHLQVKEEQRPNTYQPKLLLGKDEYESFDEIYERYIVPCNNHIETVTNNKKFSHESIEHMEKRLKEEKEKDVSLVPYGFCVTEKAPQYLVLIYVPKDRVEKEYIKVKPDGLSFHGLVHSTLKELIAWFKINFRSTEYKSYMRKTKPPFQDNGLASQHNQNWDVKRERGKDEKVKYEGTDYSGYYCSRCNKKGHVANDCREKDRSNRRPDSQRGKIGGGDKRGETACFHCQEVGHFKRNCPQLSNNPRLSSNREQSQHFANDGWNAGSGYQRDRSQSRERNDINY